VDEVDVNVERRVDHAAWAETQLGQVLFQRQRHAGRAQARQWQAWPVNLACRCRPCPARSRRGGRVAAWCVLPGAGPNRRATVPAATIRLLHGRRTGTARSYAQAKHPAMMRGLFDIPVRRALRVVGFDVERKRPVLIDLLARHEVGTVLDVGANVGQYARRLRAWGFRGRIISFEPLESAADELARAGRGDDLRSVYRFALGEEDRNETLNVSAASVFSSIRPVLGGLQTVFEGAAPVARQAIEVRRLDSVFHELPLGPGAVFLKVDTQGYEREVIRGAEKSLRAIAGVQLEVSLTPLYEGEATLTETVALMEAHGFVPSMMEPVAYDEHSQALLQIDCTFVRRELGVR
jgi:FkbM family methyltransferase